MTQFDERFPESSRNMYLGYYLIPKYLPQLDDEKLKAIRESFTRLIYPNSIHLNKNFFAGEIWQESLM